MSEFLKNLSSLSNSLYLDLMRGPILGQSQQDADTGL